MDSLVFLTSVFYFNLSNVIFIPRRLRSCCCFFFFHQNGVLTRRASCSESPLRCLCDRQFSRSRETTKRGLFKTLFHRRGAPPPPPNTKAVLRKPSGFWWRMHKWQCGFDQKHIYLFESTEQQFLSCVPATEIADKKLVL